jgi:ADP-ribosyl-[dinitrogen reductase] hydrolase
MNLRTSTTHPLHIAEIQPTALSGKIGITFCPGKNDTRRGGTWARDLNMDLDCIELWKASAVVTLVEQMELGWLQVPNLGSAVQHRHIDWLHMPIVDVSVPSQAFEDSWCDVGEGLRARLRDGLNVLVHCRGGIGRAGTIAARLMVEFGHTPTDAIKLVRSVRPGAIETREQEDYVYRVERLTPV